MKQKDIGDRLYAIIKEIHNSNFNLEETQEFLVEQGYICEKLKSEMINRDKCPRCSGNLIYKTIGYELSEYQGFSEKEPICIKACKDDSCGFEVN